MARTTHQTAISAVLLPTFAIQSVAAGDVAVAAQWCRQGLALFGVDPTSLHTALAVFAAVEIALANGDHELAARLHGRLLPSEGLLYAIIPPHYAKSHQGAITGLRKVLGADSFAIHVAEGGTLAWPSILRELDAYLEHVGLPQPETLPSLHDIRSHSRQDPLTERQREIVGLLARGLTNKEIAQTLGVTPKTVMHHTVAIYQKLGMRGRSETVAWAIRTGVALEPG